MSDLQKYLSAMNGKKVVMRTSGTATVDDIDAIRKSLKNEIEAQSQGAVTLMEDDDQFFTSDKKQYWPKPELKRSTVGIFSVNDGTCTFNEQGYKRNLSITESISDLRCSPLMLKLERCIAINEHDNFVVSFELMN